MRLKLSEIEYAELRQLQRNMVGTPDYVKVTCLLMFSNGRSPKSVSMVESHVLLVNSV